MSPHSLVPNKWNSNKVDRKNFEKLKLSLQNLGSFKPVIAREVGSYLEIIGGYHRCEAAKELGFPEIPVINLGSIDDQRAKEIGLVDNTRYGEDDTELLAKLLDEIDQDLMADIIPEAPVELPTLGDATSELAEGLKREAELEDSHKVLRFRLEIDKAEEIEALLSRIAHEKNIRYPDGYSNFSEALYHALIIGEE
jgi:hypothetical protein